MYQQLMAKVYDKLKAHNVAVDEDEFKHYADTASMMSIIYLGLPGNSK